MSELTSITISQLREAAGYRDGGDDDIMIVSSDRSTAWGLLRYPCRLKAMVIGLCTAGEGRATINLKEYKVVPETVVANLPENIIRIDGVSDDFQGHILVVSQDFLREAQIDLKNMIPLYIQLKNHPASTLSVEAARRLTEFYGLIRECIEDTGSLFRTEIVRGLVRAFLYKCCDQLSNLPAAEERSVKSRGEALFLRFIELLTIHHKRERSVGFYAERMHITPKYMSSLMRRLTGRSAAEWIDEYVILEAKTLLKYSGLSIQEVAYELNFSTQSFFGKYFKQHTGMSPGQYKMQ